ncbi:MAG: DNA internalization-related competence protein ComEC/Rec2 [Thermoanaerobaculia bacterium]|nr:DNA internalization-related competence protein ComEC/Rec2 [Thermoanaerobaculia bacterium]
MSYRTSPALLPCAAFVAGACLLHAGFAVANPGLLVALVGLGIAWGRRWGGVLVGFGLGALVALGPARPDLRPVPDLPIAAVGTVVDHPRPLGADDWRLRLRLALWRQGDRIEPCDTEVQLELGGEGAPPSLGSRLRVRGYWLESVPLGNGQPRRPGLPRLRVKSRQLVTEEAPPGFLARASGALRRRLEAAPALTDDGLGAAFARALVLGDAGVIPVPVRQGLTRLGLAHVLSVSGLHVAFVAGLGLLLGRRLPRWARALPAVILVVFYLLAVGPLPPLLRSAGMAALAGAALLAERPPVATNALALVAAGLVAWKPSQLGDLSFLLSLAATAGLVLLAPAFLAAWRGAEQGPTNPLQRGFAVTLAAQLTTLPWTLPLFALVTPWAAVANLVAAPWLALLLVVSLLAVGVGAFVPTLGSALGPALEALASPAWALTALPASPWVAVPWSSSPLTALILAAVIAAAFRWPRRGLPLLGLAVVALVAWRLVPDRDPPLEIAFLDVGQGDGILLRDGSRALLVDGGGSLGGGDFGGRVLLPVLARFGITRLEAVVASHEDRDHCGGLVDLAGLVAIGEVAVSRAVAATECGQALARAAPVRVLAAGDELELGRWRIAVLHPPAEAGSAGNDGSLVLRAAARGRRFLLTGDIEAATERALSAADLGADGLKVAHHGSKSSSGDAFLDRVGASLAIVSVGRRNSFGHPASVVLRRFADRGIRVLRTDRDGLVVVAIEEAGRWRISLPGSPK